MYADQPGYPPIRQALKRLKDADKVVFHGGIRFDFAAIEKHYPGTLTLDKIIDTVVVSRLKDPTRKDHSLRGLGMKLGVFKGEYDGDFKAFTPTLVKYAKQDIVVGKAIFWDLKPFMDTCPQAVEIEHRAAWVIFLQERNGFTLNVEKATALQAELRQELDDIERDLQVVFPPIWVPKKTKGSAEFTPKKDDKKIGYVAGVPFSRVTLQTFNPGSTAQVVDRLVRKYGWTPTQFTPSGAPKMDEEIIQSLPYPETKALSRYNRCEKMLGQVSDGKTGWLKLVGEDGRVHGAVNSCGAATGRMSHFNPNMANVDKKDLRMREVWEARRGWKLVGIDAESAQARMLGHYLSPYDNGAHIDREINGDKKKATDTHSRNFKVILLETTANVGREGAKRCFYAYLFGARDPKLGETCIEECRNNNAEPPKESKSALGAKVRAALEQGVTGLDKLVAAVTKSWKDRTKFKWARITLRSRKGKSFTKNHKEVIRPGWVKGLDGRRIAVSAEHAVLNYLLQGGEAVVMKLALVIFHFEKIPENGWDVCSVWDHGKDLAYCVNVHDEVQIECRPEIAEAVGAAFADCIKEAGKRLGVRCPMAGSYKIGNNWKETH